LSNRSHTTTFLGKTSESAGITAGVVQASVLGPTLFNIISSTLTPISALNKYFKYADDGYLIVPGNNSNTIQNELEYHSQWAKQQNLKLNLTKTKEMVLCKPKTKEPPSLPSIKRENNLKILGIKLDNHLNFQEHINETITSCSQSFFALRTMRQHGLHDDHLQHIFKQKVLAKLLYAVQAWWGFISKGAIHQMDAFLKRATRFGYYREDEPTMTEHIDKLDFNLFTSVITNPSHSLHKLLPPRKTTTYNLRSRGHSYILPVKDNRNFFNRCLYKFI